VREVRGLVTGEGEDIRAVLLSGGLDIRRAAGSAFRSSSWLRRAEVFALFPANVASRCPEPASLPGLSLAIGALTRQLSSVPDTLHSLAPAPCLLLMRSRMHLPAIPCLLRPSKQVQYTGVPWRIF